MLTNGVDVNAEDYLSCTPLHYAANSGNEEVVLLLLESEADANYQGVYKITPLHIATTPKVIQLLRRSGSSPYKKMIDQTHETCKGYFMPCICTVFEFSVSKAAKAAVANKSRMSVFHSLLQRSTKIANALLDEYISTNNKKLDSSDLLIIYDLTPFKRGDSMIKNTEILANYPNILQHPLYDALITLQWKCIQTRVWFLILQMILFVAFTTGLVITKTNILRPPIDKQNQSNCFFNISAPKEIFSPMQDCSTSDILPFFTFYVLTWIGVLTLFIREGLQFFATGKEYKRKNAKGEEYRDFSIYFKKWENWIDMLMIFCTTGLLIGIPIGIPNDSIQQLSSFVVALTWINLLLFSGRISSIGVYNHMYFNVAKTIFFFLMLYVPIILAFGFGFYSMMSDKPVFETAWNSGLKTMVMAIGELDYEGTFMESSLALVHVIFLFFLLFGSISLMNLLVGLAVSEISQLKQQAKQVRLEQSVSEIIFLDGLGERDLFSILQERLDASGCNKQNSFSYTKLCIPTSRAPKLRFGKQCMNWIVVHIKQLFQTLVAHSPDYSIYFYNEELKVIGPDTGFSFPKALVEDTMALLKEKGETF